MLSDRIGQKSLYLSGAGFCVLSRFLSSYYWIAKVRSSSGADDPRLQLRSDDDVCRAANTFTRMFGTKVRYTGLSFAYQFSRFLAD